MAFRRGYLEVTPEIRSAPRREGLRRLVIAWQDLHLNHLYLDLQMLIRLFCSFLEYMLLLKLCLIMSYPSVYHGKGRDLNLTRLN
jgi:hypothetical protein